MAITTTVEDLRDGGVKVIKFSGITQGDTSPNIEMHQWADRSVQVAGTFAGATLTVQGSNDGTNWATLNDANGNALDIATAGRIEQILEVTRYCRVTCATSSGANLTATFLLRRAQPLRS